MFKVSPLGTNPHDLVHRDRPPLVNHWTILILTHVSLKGIIAVNGLLLACLAEPTMEQAKWATAILCRH